MKKSFKNQRRGITAIEAIIASAILVIVMIGVSSVLAQCQRNWNMMYNRVYSDVVVESYLAKIMFDSVMRKSSATGVQTDPEHQWIEVNYYADDSSTQLDRYAKFYLEGGKLYVEHGQLNPKTATGTAIVCSNITNCSFRHNGKAAHMLLTLNNGSQQLTVGASAKLHN
jgi:Tfp pilus assembly protein PilV